MPPSSADEDTLALIRRLAEQDQITFVANTVTYDLMAHHLVRGDILDAIVEWIHAGERVKPTVIHTIPNRKGDPAYELKPVINGAPWYIKVSIDNRGGMTEGLALLSAHPEH